MRRILVLLAFLAASSLLSVSVGATAWDNGVSLSTDGTPTFPIDCTELGIRSQLDESGTPPTSNSDNQASSIASPAVLSTDIIITSIDLAYDPCIVTIPADTPVTITIHNRGEAMHGFVIDALNVAVHVSAGETVSVQLTAPAGVYEFYSDLPGHREAGMVGKLIAEDTAAVPSAGATPSQ